MANLHQVHRRHQHYSFSSTLLHSTGTPRISNESSNPHRTRSISMSNLLHQTRRQPPAKTHTYTRPTGSIYGKPPAMNERFRRYASKINPTKPPDMTMKLNYACRDYQVQEDFVSSLKFEFYKLQSKLISAEGMRYKADHRSRHDDHMNLFFNPVLTNLIAIMENSSLAQDYRNQSVINFLNFYFHLAFASPPAIRMRFRDQELDWYETRILQNKTLIFQHKKCIADPRLETTSL